MENRNPAHGFIQAKRIRPSRIQKQAAAKAEELREALQHYEAEYKRHGRHKHHNYSRVARGHRLMGELLQSFDLDKLKRKISFFLRQNTPRARLRTYSLNAFYNWTMKGPA